MDQPPNSTTDPDTTHLDLPTGDVSLNSLPEQTGGQQETGEYSPAVVEVVNATLEAQDHDPIATREDPQEVDLRDLVLGDIGSIMESLQKICGVALRQSKRTAEVTPSVLEMGENLLFQENGTGVLHGIKLGPNFTYLQPDSETDQGQPQHPKATILCRAYVLNNCHDRGSCPYLHEPILKKLKLEKDRADEWSHSSILDQTQEQSSCQSVLKEITENTTDHLKNYKDHFASLSKKTPTKDHAQVAIRTISWRTMLCRSFFSLTPALTEEILTEDMGSELMSSMYGTEITHPELHDASKDDFEFSHAPRLYEFLDIVMPPFFRGRSERIGWAETFRIICHIGRVVQAVSIYKKLLLSSRPDENYGWGSTKGSVLVITRALLEEMLQSHKGEEAQPQSCHASQEGLQKSPPIHDAAKIVFGAKRSRLFPKVLDAITQRIVDDYLNDDATLPGPFQVKGILLQQRMRRMFKSIAIEDLGREFEHVQRHYPAQSRYEELENVNRALEDFKELEFDPASLSIETLRKMDKEWKVVWTSDLSAHLAIDEKQIYVYWPSTTLFKQPRIPSTLRVEELRRTYGIIFGTSAEHLEASRQKVSEEVSQHRSKYRFTSFEIFSIGHPSCQPAQVQRKLPTYMKESSLKHLLMPYFSTIAPLPILKIYDKPPNTTIGELLASTNQHNEDILYQIQGILLYPHLDQERFDEFPYFGNRLRFLTMRLQHHKPRTIKELWRDSRDTLQWWTFWLVVIFGGLSVLIAIASLILGGFQTWASYKALDQ